MSAMSTDLGARSRRRPGSHLRRVPAVLLVPVIAAASASAAAVPEPRGSGHD